MYVNLFRWIDTIPDGSVEEPSLISLPTKNRRNSTVSSFVKGFLY